MSELLVTRELLIAAQKKRITRVEIEGLGIVCLRSLTAAQRAQMADLFNQRKPDQTNEEATREMQATMVARTLVNESGELLYGESEEDLRAIMMEFGSRLLDELANEATKVSMHKGTSIEGAAKNSSPIPTDLQPST